MPFLRLFLTYIYLSDFSPMFQFNFQVLSLTSSHTVLCQVYKRSFIYNPEIKGIHFQITQRHQLC